MFCVQYDSFDPDESDCMENRSRQPIISLQERAMELGYRSMVQYIDKFKSGQVYTHTSSVPRFRNAQHDAVNLKILTFRCR